MRFAIGIVWLRYFAVFRKDLLYAMVTTVVEPLLYLLSFGFGLGSIVGQLTADGRPVSYRAFVLAGLLGQTVMFAAFFDASYGGFVRMYYQKIFQAIAVTTITLSELLWGELLWCASRAMLATAVVLVIGVGLGDFDPVGALMILPVAFVGALMFAALGMLVAAVSRTIESISYPMYLFIIPMFLFCGVYYPLSNLPAWLQPVAYVLPLTPLLTIGRAATLGFPLEPWAPAALLGWTILCVPLARRAMRRRLVA